MLPEARGHVQIRVGTVSKPGMRLSAFGAVGSQRGFGGLPMYSNPLHVGVDFPIIREFQTMSGSRAETQPLSVDHNHSIKDIIAIDPPLDLAHVHSTLGDIGNLQQNERSQTLARTS